MTLSSNANRQILMDMLAYVFWHWPPRDGESDAYETALIHFHRALAQRRPEGFHRSFVRRLPGAPWAETDGPVYEDWYLVEDFAALGVLNDGAVTGVSRDPHDRVAVQAEGGAGGVYRLRAGRPALDEARHALWVAKPPGVPYDDFFGLLSPTVAEADGGLWQRQMVLGPAPEFCLLASDVVALPAGLDPLALDVEKILVGV